MKKRELEASQKENGGGQECLGVCVCTGIYVRVCGEESKTMMAKRQSNDDNRCTVVK